MAELLGKLYPAHGRISQLFPVFRTRPVSSWICIRHLGKGKVGSRVNDCSNERPETWVTKRSGHMGDTSRQACLAGGVECPGRSVRLWMNVYGLLLDF